MNNKLLLVLIVVFGFVRPAAAEHFMVTTTEGPGFKSPAEMAAVLENGILPMFEALQKLQDDKLIVAGGIAVGSRSFYLIVNADSHDAVDRMLRGLPAWGVFSWKVVPLQSLAGRAKMERENLDALMAQP